MLSQDRAAERLIHHAAMAAQGTYDSLKSRFPDPWREVTPAQWDLLFSTAVIGIAFSEIADSLPSPHAEAVAESIKMGLDKKNPRLWDGAMCVFFSMLDANRDTDGNAFTMILGKWVVDNLRISPNCLAGDKRDAVLWSAIGLLIISFGHGFWKDADYSQAESASTIEMKRRETRTNLRGMRPNIDDVIECQDNPWYGIKEAEAIKRISVLRWAVLITIMGLIIISVMIRPGYTIQTRVVTVAFWSLLSIGFASLVSTIYTLFQDCEVQRTDRYGLYILLIVGLFGLAAQIASRG